MLCFILLPGSSHTDISRVDLRGTVHDETLMDTDQQTNEDTRQGSDMLSFLFHLVLVFSLQIHLTFLSVLQLTNLFFC